MKERHLYRGKAVTKHLKSIKAGDWIVGGYVPDYNIGNIGATPCIYYRGSGFYMVDVDPDTVGQCTGLRDKYDVLIFEGDIVRTKFFGRNNGKGAKFADYDVFGVVWRNAGMVLENGERRVSIGYLANSPMHFEIIGNVHDNSEYLERSKSE